MQHIAIIGNGIAGITAARYVRKLNGNCQITVISAETNHFFCPNSPNVHLHGAFNLRPNQTL